MKTTTTYMNEFTGEVFTDKTKCEQAEKESKKNFIKGLIADTELIKNICNAHTFCESCPLASKNGDCIVSTFTDNYLNIVNSLQRNND